VIWWLVSWSMYGAVFWALQSARHGSESGDPASIPRRATAALRRIFNLQGPHPLDAIAGLLARMHRGYSKSMPNGPGPWPEDPERRQHGAGPSPC
jgi:hypothetical protein